MTKLSPCPWAKGELYLAYHDTEWGVPCYDERKLFEKLCLEGQQAGLSWITVLKKRPHYRKRFHHFNPKKIAAMTDAQLNACLKDEGLIRNRLKIYGIRQNARAYLALRAEGTRLADLVWSFVDHQPRINRIKSFKQIQAETAESKAMSKALKKAGFTFVGSTICYAFMQAMGLVDDHLLSCPQHSSHKHSSHKRKSSKVKSKRRK